ncbi:hypothetical protein [Undibacterium sp.]|uniref:hypothetical protein n=1 Tax=Undibacterium sp. TaxID=1914977 RepID=UPI0037533FB9
MNKFEQVEINAARIIAQDAAHHASRYADFADLSAATIAVLLLALEIAGGKHFIKPEEDQ